MSTWDDKPNDYEHALAEIKLLRAELSEFRNAAADEIGRLYVQLGDSEMSVAKLTERLSQITKTRTELSATIDKLRAALEQLRGMTKARTEIGAIVRAALKQKP